MSFVRKISQKGLSDCFLAKYKALDGQHFACVIRVHKQKLPMFKKKKSGDCYAVAEYGQILAIGSDGRFSQETRKRFEEEYGVLLPELVK